MAKRGPQGEAISLVKLKNVAPQMKRALVSGRLTAHEIAEATVKDLPVITRETPVEFTQEISAERFREMIVDSIQGLKIMRSPDEVYLNLLISLLVQIQKIHVQGCEPTITDDKGNVVGNPTHKAYLGMVKQASSMLSTLGLTPTSRANVIAATNAAAKDAVDVTNNYDAFNRGPINVQ